MLLWYYLVEFLRGGMLEKDIEIITEMYKDLSYASVTRDIEKISSLLAEDYVLVHMTGLHQTKENYINSVKEGIPC